MKDIIFKKLAEIETTRRVNIIYACESGSRAWGFPSKDSDYDVRFIYVHPTDWYISVFQKRDVIEIPIDSDIDICGWDIKKAFGLLRKSNAALFEWLESPIVYRKIENGIGPLMSLCKEAFLPGSACWHYLAMARNTMKGIENKPLVRIKSYCYILRPILCCRWIVRHRTQPPVLFDTLMEHCLREDKIQDKVRHMLQIKEKGNESDTVAHIPELDRFFTDEFARIEKAIPANPKKPDVDSFDTALRKTLKICNASIKAQV